MLELTQVLNANDRLQQRIDEVLALMGLLLALLGL